MHELIVLMEWFSEKYVKGIDEVRRITAKFCYDFKQNF